MFPLGLLRNSFMLHRTASSSEMYFSVPFDGSTLYCYNNYGQEHTFPSRRFGLFRPSSISVCAQTLLMEYTLYLSLEWRTPHYFATVCTSLLPSLIICVPNCFPPRRYLASLFLPLFDTLHLAPWLQPRA